MLIQVNKSNSYYRDAQWVYRIIQNGCKKREISVEDDEATVVKYEGEGGLYRVRIKYNAKGGVSEIMPYLADIEFSSKGRVLFRMSDGDRIIVWSIVEGVDEDYSPIVRHGYFTVGDGRDYNAEEREILDLVESI